MLFLPSTIEERKIVKHVAGYPRVKPETFDTPFFLKDIIEGADEDSNQAITSPIIEDSIIVKKTGDASLPGNPDQNAPTVPVYEISFKTQDGQSHKLENRFAFIGYGSNSSETVLAKKFGQQKFEGDKDRSVPVLMVNAQNHAVCHSAFIGGAGSVPVTMMKSEDTNTRVSMSFYTFDQVARMNSSEPNYDVVRMDEAKFCLNNGIEVDASPCVYDSIWGALLTDDNELMINNCIPHEIKNEGAKVKSFSTMQAMGRSQELFHRNGGKFSDLFNIYSRFNELVGNFERFILAAKNPKAADYTDKEQLAKERKNRHDLRMRINACMAPHSKPRNIEGTVIQTASLTQERENCFDKKGNPSQKRMKHTKLVV